MFAIFSPSCLVSINAYKTIVHTLFLVLFLFNSFVASVICFLFSTIFRQFFYSLSACGFLRVSVSVCFTFLKVLVYAFVYCFLKSLPSLFGLLFYFSVLSIFFLVISLLKKSLWTVSVVVGYILLRKKVL